MGGVGQGGGPVERVRHTMVWDAARARALVFAGEDRDRYLQNNLFAIDVQAGEQNSCDFVFSMIDKLPLRD